MDKTLYTLIVHSENMAGLLNQITAVFTRRQINIESLNVSASSIKGVHKYTITVWTTKDIIEKVVKQIEKKIDVLQAHYFTDDEIFLHEIALYKVSIPEFQSNPIASKVIRRYNARIVEVNPVFAIVEKAGQRKSLLCMRSCRHWVAYCSLSVRGVWLSLPAALSVSMSILHSVRKNIVNRRKERSCNE